MHSNGTNNEIDRKNFECTICYELLLYPVRLPCNHCFCKLCFDQHVENNRLCCPICRKRISNWLRKCTKNDIIDEECWKTIKKLYPNEIKSRINGHCDYQTDIIYFKEKVAKFDHEEKKRALKVHQALESNSANDLEVNWNGWPDHVYTICRNILQSAVNQSTPLTEDNTPRRSLAKPGEIHQEYETLRQKELEESKREAEKNLRLNEDWIKMNEEEERKKEEERLRQLKEDEELARRLANKLLESTDDDDSLSVGEEERKIEEVRLRQLQEDEKLARRLSSNCSESSESTSDKDTSSVEFIKEVKGTRHSSVIPNSPCSPGPLNTPSTSKADVFAKFYVKSYSISNEELSNFASVKPGPSNVTNGPKVKKLAASSSRCSSGCDSIGQEFHHFKPIRSSPTTPPKAGSSGLVPKKVVPQRGVGLTELLENPLVLVNDGDLLDANLSLEDLEASIRLEKQIEEDKRIALEIQEQLNEEITKTPVRTDYNLRKRKRSSGSLKKKLLIDRTQTTLDKLLIK